MVQETLYNWQRFLRTKDSWMGNIHPDEAEDFEYYKAHKLDIDEFERKVLTIQQHRSQAHTENRTRELARSQYADDKRLAVFKMVEQINLQTKISTEFLDLLSNQMLFLEKKELLDESKDIWANIKFATDEGPDDDNASETDDEATRDNIDNGLRKTRATNPKADDEIMLFEKEVDHITSLNPNKRR